MTLHGSIALGDVIYFLYESGYGVSFLYCSCHFPHETGVDVAMEEQEEQLVPQAQQDLVQQPRNLERSISKCHYMLSELMQIHTLS